MSIFLGQPFVFAFVSLLCSSLGLVCVAFQGYWEGLGAFIWERWLHAIKQSEAWSPMISWPPLAANPYPLPPLLSISRIKHEIAVITAELKPAEAAIFPHHSPDG